jgi:hypothetical protein
MMQSANKGEDAVAITPTWADAWFYKSYALTQLHRTAEAVAALDITRRRTGSARWRCTRPPTRR